MSESEALKRSPKKLSLWTKLSHGFGCSAFGVKDNGFNYFLLLFYTQVIGLDPRLVGLAILIALIVDAISDPLVGYWSDNLRTRWGRRHPFMYAAALPVAVFYFLLWNPPDWSEQGLFWYVLGLAIVIRTFITFYETPSTALNAELTQDYNERSSLIGYRLYFAWTVGNFMTVLMFFFLFPVFTNADHPDGMFNRDAYQVYGIVASGVMFLAITIASIGTHSRIPHLKTPPVRRNINVSVVFREIFETLSNRSFVALFGGAMFGAIATGLAAALAFYFLAYFWEFTNIQRGIIVLGTFPAAVIGGLLTPFVTKTIGKKRGAIIVGIIAFLGAPAPIFLRLMGWLPENGDSALFWIIFITQMVDVGLIICFQALVQSMLADLVEQSELQTGRRSEGVFAAATTFIRKMVQGLGLQVATFLLVLANFPAQSDTTEVPQEAITSLGAYYVPTILCIWGLMMLCLAFYNINRDVHEENLRKLGIQKMKE